MIDKKKKKNKKRERRRKLSAFKPTDCTEQYSVKQSLNTMPHLQTESIFCHHKLKWWLWDQRMKTMYSVLSCFAEPNLHPFPRTAHFTNIRRRFSIVSNCHHSFPSTECLWKRRGTHLHGPLMFLWVLSFWISWVLAGGGGGYRENHILFIRLKLLFKNILQFDQHIKLQYYFY